MQNRFLALFFFALTLVSTSRPDTATQALALLKRPSVGLGLLGCAAQGASWYQEKQAKKLKGINKVADLLKPEKRNSPDNPKKVAYKVGAAVSRSIRNNFFVMALHTEGMAQLISRGILPKLSNKSAFRAYGIGLSSAFFALAMSVPAAIFNSAASLKVIPIPHDDVSWNAPENQEIINTVAKMWMPNATPFEIGRRIGPLKAMLYWPVIMAGKTVRSGALVPGAGIAAQYGVSLERAASVSNYLMAAGKHLTIAAGMYLKLA